MSKMIKLEPWYYATSCTRSTFEQLQRTPAPFLIALAALIASVFTAYHQVQTRRKASLDLVSNRCITSLYIYPIKSFRGIRLPTSTITPSGLAYDRIYTLATRNRRTGAYTVLTSYDNTAVARFTVEFTPSPTSLPISDNPTHIRVSVLGGQDTNPTLVLPLQADISTLELVPFQIWDANAMDAYDMGDETASFFEPFKLSGKQEDEEEVRLLYKGPMVRKLSGHGAQYKDGQTAFAYYLPLLVANEASLADLNARMQEGDKTGRTSISMERFRPNIVVSGEGGAWEEDDWREVRMGDEVGVDVVSRCVRCSVPCIDPETGLKDKMEPSRTLSKFRRIDAGRPSLTCFGMLAVPRTMGIVAVGDTVRVMRRGEHYYVKGY